jgi:hypothetical protein
MLVTQKIHNHAVSLTVCPLYFQTIHLYILQYQVETCNPFELAHLIYLAVGI